MIQVRIRKQFAAGRESAGFSLDVEFRADSGVTVLFGSSGSGKTLTLDAIAGFVRPDEGRIMLDDDILFDGAAGVHLAPQSRNCGYVFQNYALFPHMTIRKNLEFAVASRPRLERHRRVAELLDAFRLNDVAGRRPHEVSGGQKQRCSIARALIGEPRMLLLDEPARGLDAPLRSEFYSVLRQVRRDFPTPVLLVTHDLDESFELGDEMIVMREGRVVQTGPPAQVLERPANIEVARLFGRYVLLDAEILSLDPGRNQSRLRLDGYELNGPYFPGHLLGDHVTVYLVPSALRAHPRLNKPGPNQVEAALRRVVDVPGAVRLEFDHDLTVETAAKPTRDDLAAKDWIIEIPAESVRVL